MTDMKIESNILTKIIEKIACRALFKKFGGGCGINIGKLQVNMSDHIAEITFNGTIKLPSKAILKLITDGEDVNETRI